MTDLLSDVLLFLSLILLAANMFMLVFPASAKAWFAALVVVFVVIVAAAVLLS